MYPRILEFIFEVIVLDSVSDKSVGFQIKHIA